MHRAIWSSTFETTSPSRCDTSGEESTEFSLFFIKIISLSWFANSRPRRKVKISIEALFMIDFPSAKNKFTFYLDRKSKRVTIDINSNSQIFTKHLTAPSLNETTTIRSLAVSFAGNTVSLYVDCKDVYTDEMEFNLSKLYLNMDEPDVKLLRERKYPLFLDRSVESALTRANCQKSSKQKGNRKMMKDSEYGYFNGEDLLQSAIRRVHKLRQCFIEVLRKTKLH